MQLGSFSDIQAKSIVFSAISVKLGKMGYLFITGNRS